MDDKEIREKLSKTQEALMVAESLLEGALRQSVWVRTLLRELEARETEKSPQT
jgi:hypothetical protein